MEANALATVNKLDHPHIIKCIAAIRRGNSRHFMFPWADGDSLRDYWDGAPRQAPNATAIKQAIVQLRGIADALDRLHNFDGSHSNDLDVENSVPINLESPSITEQRIHNSGNGYTETQLDNEVDDYKNAERSGSIRHGDLKPENILRFLNKQAGLGDLKIADMGLAKRHVVATAQRGNKATSTRFGTRRYEAPETITENNARSRLYDIWSMGCITFEFIVWILYGNSELNNLYKQIEGNAQQICQYYEIVDSNDPEGARIHPVVSRWMEYIRNKDPECSTNSNSAIKDLLEVVQERLLIVPLPPNRKSSTTGGRGLAPPALGRTVAQYRATAAEFRDALDSILSKADEPGYLFTGNDRAGAKPPRAPLLSPNTATLSPGPGAPKINATTLGPLKSGVLGRPIGADYTLPPMKDWEFIVDSAFAERLVAEVGVHSLASKVLTVPKLCTRCLNRNFWKGGFSIEENVSDLKGWAANCDLCRMLHGIFDEAEEPKGEVVRFVRNQSNMMLPGDPFPVISIFRSPELHPPFPIQVGFPELPEPGSDTFFSIIKLWLQDCDLGHRSCQGASGYLPTRLIDVGSLEEPSLRLVETKRDNVLNKQYIALSHPWGDKFKHPPFRTLPENIESFARSIPENQLPATFKDAVNCTRKLNIRYLWIDSLCIIQGPYGDFNAESKRMEGVFSGAYCVLAASRANGQRDGFLSHRPQREYITFQRGAEKPFYVCKTIDNFSRDVIEGSLNKRGWVLQERALARRTIYFTKNQTYFECGNGVRCETLTKMHK